MQKDFHYCAIAVLARAAGFEFEDALTIAHASQYVDDARDNAPLTINGEPFTPVLTAHEGLASAAESTFREVYVPFHFFPARAQPALPAGLVTEPNSPLARELVDRALTQEEGLARLVSLGVALHTYADTWAHQGFCGWLADLNRVREMRVRRNGDYELLPLQDLDPTHFLDLGHLQAWSLPDQPYRVWSYRAGAQERLVFRDNRTEFLAASRAIYSRLLEASPRSGNAPAWRDLADQVERALSYDSDESEARCRRWRQRFAHLFPHQDWEYDSLIWRLQAIERDDSFNANGEEYRWKGDPAELPWAVFHAAARRQRDWVRDRVFA